jgi:hypothetical protein
MTRAGTGLAIHKKAWIKLAIPASISLLAISILSMHLVSKANHPGNSFSEPLYIECMGMTC